MVDVKCSNESHVVQKLNCDALRSKLGGRLVGCSLSTNGNRQMYVSVTVWDREHGKQCTAQATLMDSEGKRCLLAPPDGVDVAVLPQEVEASKGRAIDRALCLLATMMEKHRKTKHVEYA